MAYLRSITTGNKVPCNIEKRSLVRKLFFLPSVKVSYTYLGLTTSTYNVRWFYPSEVHFD